MIFVFSFKFDEWFLFLLHSVLHSLDQKRNHRHITHCVLFRVLFVGKIIEMVIVLYNTKTPKAIYGIGNCLSTISNTIYCPATSVFSESLFNKTPIIYINILKLLRKKPYQHQNRFGMVILIPLSMRQSFHFWAAVLKWTKSC